MQRRGHHGRVDANQAEIVKSLRMCGVSVQSLASVGSGCPDILCGFRGRNYLFEIKKSPKEKLTDDELTWFHRWTGRCGVIYNAQDALLMMLDSAHIEGA